MNHLHPPEGPQPPLAHSPYDSKWRPSYLPPYDHHPESRRLSAPTQGPSPPQTYPMQSRELPQLPPEGPYGRPSSLPGPSHSIPEPSPLHTGYRPPISGSPTDSSPHSATPDYRSRMAYPPPEPAASTESTPPISSHLPPTSQYMQAPPIPTGTPAPYDAFYSSAAARQRKANRATQVSFFVIESSNPRKLFCADMMDSLRLATNVEHGKPSVMRAGRLAVIVKRMESIACTRRSRRISLCSTK